MTKIIAIANQKGGVGKTTTAINLSAGLAMKDFGFNVQKPILSLPGQEKNLYKLNFNQ